MKQDQSTSLTIRLSHDFHQRLEHLQIEMSKRLSGMEVRWSQVIRLALEKGAEVLERELQLKK